MTVVRVGTRGSALAKAQTSAVCEALHSVHQSLQLEVVELRTAGDETAALPSDPSFPRGAFVGTIERALLRGEIDLAVHSMKDLGSRDADGLVVAAIPKRAAAHDVLVTRVSVHIDNVPKGMRIGTGSPRRRAQLLRDFDVDVVPIRGNVPTRLEMVEDGTLDGVVLAAAGIERLGLSSAHVLALPPDRFVPAACQGALAVQCRAGDERIEAFTGLNDAATERCVRAERELLAMIGAGCQTPVGAHVWKGQAGFVLRAQWFREARREPAEAVLRGADPVELAKRAATDLLAAT